MARQGPGARRRPRRRGARKVDASRGIEKLGASGGGPACAACGRQRRPAPRIPPLPHQRAPLRPAAKQQEEEEEEEEDEVTGGGSFVPAMVGSTGAAATVCNSASPPLAERNSAPGGDRSRYCSGPAGSPSPAHVDIEAGHKRQAQP